ncbi:MAG TPA: hypothetical protein VIL46_13750, partial [Gemmataceae bacterium]
VAALAAALGRWLDDPDGLARRRALARRQAEERFDIRKLADELWSEYRALLGRPVAPAEPRPESALQSLR